MKSLLVLFLQFTIVCGLLCNRANLHAVEIIAHRGESADAPENTMAAFRLAWERGVRAIELDLHLSKDNQLVVIHDADTKRTAGEKRIIKDSMFEELQHLDVGHWKNPKWSGEKLVTLESALATIPSGCRCFIEVKVGPEAVPALVKAIEKSGKQADQLCVISFKADTVAEAKKHLPQLPAYYLAEFKRDKESKEWKPTIDELIAKAKSIHADGLDLGYKGPIDATMVQKVKSTGLQFYVWTIDDIEVARKFAEMGVDGITTNKAAWMQEQRLPTPMEKSRP